MTGHKTESVYRRYAIVDEAMLREGAEKLAAFHSGKRQLGERSYLSSRVDRILTRPTKFL
jgi:hypothetical protein